MSQTLIHVHTLPLTGLDDNERAGLLELLSPADLAGFAQHPETRERQILARALTRRLLAEATGLPARELEFRRSEQGKPYLANASVRFNISHSQRAFALAWTAAELELGVDIEDMARRLQEARLARRSFTPGEIAAWEAAANPRQQWLTTWTSKEALLKATGIGIRLDLASVDTATRDADGCVCHPELGRLLSRSWSSSSNVWSLAWNADHADTRIELVDRLGPL